MTDLSTVLGPSSGSCRKCGAHISINPPRPCAHCARVEQIREKKAEAVRHQRYEDAADLRMQERSLLMGGPRLEKTICVNLIAGPGAGKSTVCAGVFNLLKWDGIRSEMATEYAKDKVWEGSDRVLDNQVYVFGKQHHRLARLRGKVDVIVTDSPLYLSVYYDSLKRPALRELVLSEASNYDNMNFLLTRTKEYDPVGRQQSESDARKVDAGLREFLDSSGIPYTELVAQKGCEEQIVKAIKFRLYYSDPPKE